MIIAVRIRARHWRPILLIESRCWYIHRIHQWKFVLHFFSSSIFLCCWEPLHVNGCDINTSSSSPKRQIDWDKRASSVCLFLRLLYGCLKKCKICFPVCDERAITWRRNKPLEFYLQKRKKFCDCAYHFDKIGFYIDKNARNEQFKYFISI